jgi:hypothetical protein
LLHRHTFAIQPESRRARQAKGFAAFESTQEPHALLQSCQSWQLVRPPATAGHSELTAPRVLLIDGTNLACISSGGKHNRGSRFRQPVEARFIAWIKFLKAFAQAPIAIIAFDNKGSINANFRALLAPNYLQKRYKQQQTGTAAASQEQKHHQKQQMQPPQHQHQLAAAKTQSLSGWGQLAAAAEREAGCIAFHAAYGFEADDALAAAVETVRKQLPPSAAAISRRHPSTDAAISDAWRNPFKPCSGPTALSQTDHPT